MPQIIHTTKSTFDLGTYNNLYCTDRGVVIAPIKNQITNASFEYDVPYWDKWQAPDGIASAWGFYRPGGSSDTFVASLDSTTSMSGKSQKIYYTSTTGKEIYFGQHIVSLLANTDYNFSIYAKIDNPTNFTCYLLMQYWQDDTTYISNIISSASSPTAFTRLSVTGKTPSNCNTIRAWIVLVPNTTNVSCTLWVDNAQLEIGTSASSYTPKYLLNTGTYTSSVINLQGLANAHKLEITAAILPNTSIQVQMRSSQTQAGLTSAPWLGIDTNNQYYTASAGSTYNSQVKEWRINTSHILDNYIQYKVIFSTTDLGYFPSLYDVRINYGNSTPEVRSADFNLYGNPCYSFHIGDIINFVITAVEYKGIENLVSANIILLDNLNITHNIPLNKSINIDAIQQVYTGSLTVPNSPVHIGSTWNGTINVKNSTTTYAEPITIKIKRDYTIAPKKMDIGILQNYGLRDYLNPNLIISQYTSYLGIDIWKIGLSWERLETKRGIFDPAYINAITQILTAASLNNAKVQIGIAQQFYPQWVKNGSWDDGNRYYDYVENKYLTETWTRLTDILKSYPSFDSYLIINEENFIFDGFKYVISNNRVVSAIKYHDSNTKHRVTIRPNVRPTAINSYDRTVITNNGNHDIDYGTGIYPTGSNGWALHANPISDTSFLRTSQERLMPFELNNEGGVGEVGFFKGSLDTCTDNDKLVGFKRLMSIAYDLGFTEFMLWEGAFSFSDPQTYYPLLKQFKDLLLSKNRLTHFNVCFVIDTYDFLYVGTITSTNPELDMTTEPYYYVIKFLDEHGYSWYYTSQNALSIQPRLFDTVIYSSEIKGQTIDNQNILLSSRLSGVTPNAPLYIWDTGDIIFPIPTSTPTPTPPPNLPEGSTELIQLLMAGTIAGTLIGTAMLLLSGKRDY